MYIKNPIDQDVKVNYLGTEYVIGANETKEFPDDLGAHFIRIYDFMEQTSAPAKAETAKAVETAKPKAKKK